MVQSKAKTVEQYINELPEDRKKAISEVRKVILKYLPKGYKEMMLYGTIGYAIPLEKYPETYNGQPLGIAALASQKNHMAVYLSNIYSDKEAMKWFESEFKKSGKKLNMGKSCVRFTKLENLPVEVIGKAIARTPPDKLIELYEKSRKKN